MRRNEPETGGGLVLVAGRVARVVLKAPIFLYRFTLKPFVGWNCRHLPTCSEYALEAIDTNGAWRGLWLTVSRLSRCRPWGTAGYDPVPDIRAERHNLLPWRYGRWSGSHMGEQWRTAEKGICGRGACRGHPPPPVPPATGSG
ncbi:MAG: membrane protein insertion efficiency factor YidD [Hyphomicrobiaceae bacterium]|nr:membrane protein insertion efficiency factor YidD [Hyphomicrobiaceae bacterium]